MNRLTDSELMDGLKKRFDENERTLNALKLLNDKLVDVNKRLQESETLKSNFLSNIRNEINNPLTSILCMSKVLTAGGGISSEAISSMAGSIYSDAFNLDFQLRNIFAAAEFEAGEAAPGIARVNIDSLIYNSIESFLHRADDKRISMTFEPLIESGNGPHFNTDPEKLQLVINNLLSNAIEYSHEGGLVEITALKEGRHLNISIKDHGTGIDEKDVRNIFDRFKQLDSGISKSHLGHGLGASIIKSMVDLLNGTISVSSAKGRGSAFTVSIPEAESGPGIDVFSADSNEFFFEVEEEREF